MKRDTFVLFVALGCGILAFGLIFNFLKQAAKPKNQFVMTVTNIPKGKIFSQEDLAISEPLKDIPADQYFTQFSDVVGMEAVEDLPQNKLINRTNIKKPPPPKKVEPSPSPSPKDKEAVRETPKMVSLPMPPGKKGLNLTPQELGTIPTLLKPGDYVDILGDIMIGAKSQKEVRTIATGALILSVQGTEKKIDSVNLALSPHQVETLLNVSREGKMRLILSSENDMDAAPSVTAIEIIRGIQREKKMA